MKCISIIIRYNDTSSYANDKIDKMIASLIDQNYARWELILIDERNPGSPYPDINRHEQIIHTTGNFKNRAQALNHGIQQASGEYIMLIDNIAANVLFRLSTLETFLLCAEKGANTGMIYSDYLLMDGNGKSKEINLLTYHKGRVRDNMDYGPVTFFPRKVIEEMGGLNEQYNAADTYDLRLKVSSVYDIVHINAANNGYCYIVESGEREHNIFDYLIASRDVQLEMEETLTEHLKRIDAYLAPGTHYRAIPSSRKEEYSECIASVIIPVYGREEFIRSAIESVQAQTVQNVEVIIVCNGGKEDATIQGVIPYLPGGDRYDPEKPAVRLFVEDINNIGFCLNKGLREAKGKYYVQLDSDDRLKPDAIEKILEVFNADPQVGMVIGSYEVWVKDDKTGEISRMEEIPAVTHAEWTEENGRNNLLRINGAGAPRAAHIAVIQGLGGFGMNDIEYCKNYGEDYDMVLRISEQYKIGRIWEPIYEVIRHSGGTDHSIDQLTIDRNDRTKDWMRQKAIERRIGMNGRKNK
ncbi:glycosyltransferase [bacterium]|nr:glycosyltransferase [bacterium]